MRRPPPRWLTTVVLVAALSFPVPALAAAGRTGDPDPQPGPTSTSGTTTDDVDWSPLEQRCRSTLMIVAHRGTGIGTHKVGGKRYTENTAEAFAKALTYRMCGIETDVRQVRGGFVAMHDSTLDRTTNGKGKVRRHTLAAVLRLVTPARTHPPSLPEILQPSLDADTCFQQQEIRPGSMSNRGVRRMIKVDVLTLKSRDCVLYTSTSKRVLRFVKFVDKRLGTGWIDEDPHHRPAIRSVPRYVDRLLLDRRALDAKYVRAAHARGIDVSARSVNSWRQLRQVRAMGVRYVVTDKPWVFAPKS